MQKTFLDMQNKSLAALTIGALMVSTLGASLSVSVPMIANAAVEQSCSTITLVSGTSSQTAGYTETTQAGPATALLPASYSGGALGAATITQSVIPPWVDPAVDANFTGSGATWISTNATWPGGTDNTEGSASNDQWRLFQDSFTLPADATVTDANVWYTADNGTDVYLNGNLTPISTTGDVYGAPADPSAQHFANVFTTSFTPVAGNNTLNFVTRNWGGDFTSNPTGLLYKAVINYCVPVVPPPPTSVKVTIDKYVDGQQATASSSKNNEFPMGATWNAENIGAGTGAYALGPTGFNSENSYEAVTADMTSGADYATNEVTDGPVVAAACVSGTTTPPFALVGYTTGNTREEAAAGTPTTTIPSFTGLTNDKFVIVWNKTCSATSGDITGDVTTDHGTLAVTSIDSVDTTASADNSYADGWVYVFHVTLPTNESNLAMKFSNWLSGSSTIPVASNMRISSAQADNAGATITVAAANTYTTPDLHMVTDLNPVMPGIQTEVTVEVKIPVGTPNATYSTNYGVRSE